MGKKKSKRSANLIRRRIPETTLHNDFQSGVSKMVSEENENTNFTSQAPSALSMNFDEFDEEEFKEKKGYQKHAYKTVFLSSENVTTHSRSGNTDSNKDNGSRNKLGSYHDLVDGGAYEDFPSKFRTNSSRGDFESSGDRVLAGSRSFSHRSLFSNGNRPSSQIAPTFSFPSVDKLPEYEQTAPKMDFNVFGDSTEVRRSRDNSTRRSCNSTQISDAGSHSKKTEEQVESAGNRFSRVSIHSSNDEFVLIGGHPPSFSTSVGESFADNQRNTEGKEIFIPRTRSNISIEQQGFPNKEQLSDSKTKLSIEIPISRSSSKQSVETTSNTDDRLFLAAKYSLSPEAEGVADIVSSRNNSRSSSSLSIENTGFVEIPFNTHADSGMTHVSEFLHPRSTPRSPQHALVVTSALTPLIPKRNSQSLSHSNDSIVIPTPQTVQKAPHSKQSFRSVLNPELIPKETNEVAVQTGSTIRLRQNQRADVLSELAYLPKKDDFEATNLMERPFDSKTNCRSRLREISEFYNSDTTENEKNLSERLKVCVPPTNPLNLRVEPNERFEPQPISFGGESKKTNGGDTIKKHVPKGRIRDLAAVFNSVNDAQKLPARPFECYTATRDVQERSKKEPSYDKDSSLNKNRKFSSSNASKTSTQTLHSHEDHRRSTSSSSQYLPHIFTRNTFLVRDSDTNKLPGSASSRSLSLQRELVPPSTKQEGSRKNSASSRSRVSIGETNSFKSQVSDVVPRSVEVHIHKFKPIEKKMSVVRAKTQEISPIVDLEGQYSSRAVSDNICDNEISIPSENLSKKFGKETAMNQKEWPSFYQQWDLNSRPESTIYKEKLYSKPSWNDPERFTNKLPTMENPYQLARNANPLKMKPQEMDDTSLNKNKTMSSRNPYSPPATEDAGSRITHHTSTTLQDDLFTTEDSIRGKIDKMFDFVESDDSRKTLRDYWNSPSSTITLGVTSNSVLEQPKHSGPIHRQSDVVGNWSGSFPENQRSFDNFTKNAEKDTLDEAKPTHRTLKSPERRNTVTGSGFNHADSELDYSLSQYREIQRAQLRKRLPSTDEPQFFLPPPLESGSPGEKLYYSQYETERRNLPAALATSTPLDSPQSRSSFLPKEILEFNNNHVPNETFVSSISAASATLDRSDVNRKIDRLTYMIENTQKQMEMNGAALADALKKGRRVQEVAANRSILITRETLRLQRNELRRLHSVSAHRRTPPAPLAKELRGSVIFNDLAVDLDKLFVSRLTAKDENAYFFMALFKFGHQLEATEVVPLRIKPEGAPEKICFEKQIAFSDVPVDFKIAVEIYAMKLSPEKTIDVSIGTAFANRCRSLIGPPQKKVQTPPTETAFKFRGRLILDRDASGDRRFYLDDVTYPLEGTLNIKTECSKLPDVFEADFRAFLTMFHTISGMASWERYWAVVRRGTVFFWKYPEDEQLGREPKMQIDLAKCTNNIVEKCTFELCPKPNSFAIELIDTDDVGRSAAKKRILLSTDSIEAMTQWLFVINQTLDVIRGPI